MTFAMCCQSSITIMKDISIHVSSHLTEWESNIHFTFSSGLISTKELSAAGSITLPNVQLSSGASCYHFLLKKKKDCLRGMMRVVRGNHTVKV